MVNWWIMHKTLHLREAKFMVCVFVLRSPSCTLHFIVPMPFWSLCDFFWTRIFNIECSTLFVWSETALESIVGAL